MSMNDRKIRVLVVDDSRTAREMVISVISSDPSLTVIGEARDGLEAVGKAIALKPDIITMDIEMPVMNGIEAIERIMSQMPMPVIALTSISGVKTAFSAVTKGALDVIEKTDLTQNNGAKLIKRLKMLADVDVAAHLLAMKGRSLKICPPENAAHDVSPQEEGEIRIIAFAASTGGPQALSSILSVLPENYGIPILVAQHVAPGFTSGMADWLDSCSRLSVKEACKGEKAMPGHVYLNPSEYSMRIDRNGIISLFEESPGQIYHPCCDDLLLSVADSFGIRAAGIILSGMGRDGVAGMESIKLSGGITIAQDEQSSTIFGMNGMAVKKGLIKKVLPLQEIAHEMIRLAGTKDGSI